MMMPQQITERRISSARTSFTTGPACSPSRTALATGVYQTALGAYHMRYSAALRPELPAPVKILPQLMRENG